MMVEQQTANANAWFFWIPKTAGTAIHDRLQTDGKPGRRPDGDLVWIPQTSFEVRYCDHLTPRMIVERKIATREQLDQAFTFAVVRDPVQRFASMWRNWKWKIPYESPSEFTANLDNRRLRNRNGVALTFAQSRWLAWPDGSPTCDRVLRFETLDEDWKCVADTLGVQQVLHKQNVSGGGNADVFDAEDIRRIRQHERYVVEKYGY